ncbi:MAG: SGNH/GDSL hydrolase family protein [Wujia sp.]
MRDFKSKRKQILQILGFFLVVFIVLSIASVLLDPVRLGMYDEVSERERYMLSLLAEPENTVDVVVLGDSESYTFISPMELWEKYGMTSYIAGQAGQHLPETFYSLKRIMKRQNPKVVIVETNEIFSPESNLYEAGYSIREMGYYCFPVLKYHNLWKYMVEEGEAYPLHFNGFEVRTTIQPYTGGPYMQQTDEQDAILFVCQYYLRKINELCEKNGARLLLVTAPSALNHTMQRHNALENYAKKTGIPYLDLNEKTDELGIDWATDTLDGGDHLNFSGALKTNAYMGQYLDEHYELPDHRGEDAYKPWDVRLEEYKKECAKF